MRIEEFYSANKTFYAHQQNEKKKKETLKEHTELCCDYFQKIFPEKKYEIFWKKLKMMWEKENLDINTEELIKELWYSTPFFHDMGKINPIFQSKNMNNVIINSQGMKAFAPLSSRHSLFSAVLYINTFARKIKENICDKEQRRYCIFFMFCNAYVISRHHSSLSCFDQFLESFYEEKEGYEIVEILNGIYGKELYLEEIFLTIKEDKVVGTNFELLKPLKIFRKKYITDKIAPLFYTYVRLLYSVLIAADYYSTTEFCNDIKTDMVSYKEDIEKMHNLFQKSDLIQKINQYEKNEYGKRDNFQQVNDINIMRNELFLDAKNSLLEKINQNIYYLEAPTGSGKSNTAFQLSFLLQEMNHMEKIFYVYPFNTLVEQNYKTMETIFGKIENIMEDIAVINSITPISIGNLENVKEDNNNLYTKALLNRQFLNYPIILTTSVSLFQYLFSQKQESLMGFHKFQNSVIILDEIQNYKNSIWTEIITFLDTFSELLNMKIIIMSATLPDLNYLICNDHKAVKLIEDREKYYLNPIFANRVFLHYDLMQEKVTMETLYNHIKQHQNSKKKILIEFINKKSATEFYILLKEKEEQRELFWAQIILMTGDDNQEERKHLIALTKEERKEKSLIFVATQVVEAGVDIDMDIGYKDCSLLDAEEQFLGRINRSCKKTGEVWFFDMDNEKTIYQEDLRVPSEFTIRKEPIREILNSKDFSKYYIPLLNNLKERNEEINENNIEIFFKKCVGELDFKKVEERMKLLNENDWTVSVYLCRDIKLEDGNILYAKEIWEEYKELLKNESMNYAKKRVLLSEIQSKMNYFIYEIKPCDFIWNDQIGELYCIEEADEYFIDNKFNIDAFEHSAGTII